MLVERPFGTHLSQSSIPGGISPLVRNDGNKLVTQAVLRSGGKAVLALLGVGGVACFGVGVAAGLAARRAKGWADRSHVEARLAHADTGADVEISAGPSTDCATPEAEQADTAELRAV